MNTVLALSTNIELSESSIAVKYAVAASCLKHSIKGGFNAKELEKRYGSRVRSRLREMFNLISFT